MIKSMTGFGQARHDDGALRINVEVKSLNSKYLDLGLKFPKQFSEKELDLRNLINDKLERGKISISIEWERYGQQEVKQVYNEKLFLTYLENLKKLEASSKTLANNIFELALNSPDVIQTRLESESIEEDWNKINGVLLIAINQCDEFRKAEGKSLAVKLKEYISVIDQALSKVIELDPKRVQKIRERIRGNVTNFFGEEGYDKNRLEQEIIFYIEKLDIHEERVRLKTHLDYFLQILEEKQSNGKKLAFLSQEIGREINTIGSKANDAEIQKHVVAMKEELEKIKEQLNNVL
ncbi:MAG TPA: YicC family protein [Cyclobacteriaceae bacterium]|nr:YicC family protein [Cyclobacteriaceae bacterium]HMV07402.1 YicC family protein [Cyclobacteriaceae bacterium]HMV88994.1 YicC family protein [Cyclobacteriaceae bacterium]HMW99243.1 YicC family protein [Cyclobacteriaceae bacterium]HMX48968.1 YicC family protein [Cyclobacteriaceae bacterium]